MGPKKGRSGPAAKPASAPLPQINPAHLKQAQDAYQQAKERNGKKLSDSIDRLRSKGTHMSRITILRLLLEKDQPLKEYQNELSSKNKTEGYSVWLRGQLASFSKECEHPLSDERMSCTFVTALAGCWRHYIAQGFPVSATDQQQILEMLFHSLTKGFSKDSWSKDWVDPRSEIVIGTELKLADNTTTAFVAERTDSTYMLAEQYKQLSNHYVQLYRDLNGSQWQQCPKPADILKQLTSSVKEAGALVAEAARTAAEQPKQLDPKLVQQETLREQQLAARNEQQQTARGSRRDTDRRDRDVKRSAGKEAEDLVKDKELLAAQLAEDKLREAANQLLKHLEGLLFKPDQQLDKQQQLEKLEQESAHDLTKICDVLKMHNNAKDSPKAEALLEMCKRQFGDVNPSEAALLGQLEGLNSSSGCVYLDEVLKADSSSGPNSRKKHTWDSLEAFEEHVHSTHLSGAVDHCDSAAFDSSTNPPKLYDVYEGRFGDLLSDGDDHRVMNGVNGHAANGLMHNRKWLEAFKEECPMAKLLHVFDSSWNEETLTVPVDTSESSRLYAAIGFALLQLQRGVITPDPMKLSQQEPWVLLAYHTLKLLPALHTAPPSLQDFIIYNFWLTQSACTDEYQRIMSTDTDAHSDSTQGAVGDIITMLQMLYEAGLLQGPVLLAVQLYLIKHGGTELDVDDLARGQYMEADKAVNRLGESEQNDLRAYLFQVLQHVFASLPCYRRFLSSLQEHVHKPEAVAVQVTHNDKGEAKLSLCPAYWEQACRSASVLSEHHAPCCDKHVTLRSQSEAQGKTFSRFDMEGGCESFICSEGVVSQEDDRVAQRYLVVASHVMQAQQRTGIEIGTREGLKALVDNVYLGPDRHPLMSKIGVPPAVEPNTPKRSTWDKAHTDLLIAQQLAMHRQQLAKLIENHSRRLEASQYRLPEQDVQEMIRALFCQRVAGRQWVLYHFQQMFEQQRDQLRCDEQQLQNQLRMLGDAAEHKTNKSSKADNSKEKEKELNEKLQRCIKGIAETETYLAGIKTLLAEQGTEAESYPDLLRVRHRAAAGRVDPIEQILHLLCNELLNEHAHTCAQLEDALKMSWQMLFELDSMVMFHVLSARKRVLVSAWAHREVPVAVRLAAESLRMQLEQHMQAATVKELMAMDQEDKKAVQQQPSSKKKKKKKGPAQKPAAAKAAAAAPDSDEPEESQQEAAADQEAQQQEDDEQQQQPEDDGEEMVDITSLPIFNRSSKGKEDSGSSNALQSAAASADSRVRKGAATAGSEATAGPASKSSRPVSMTAQQLQVERYIYYGGTPICGRCGDMSHKTGDCRTNQCRTCKKWGHETGWCGSACSNCGRKSHGTRPRDEGCTLKRCTNCHLMGHIARECPRAECCNCGLMGHRPTDCLREVYACKQCRQPRYEGHECVGRPVKPAEVEQPTLPAAAAAATETRASSRGRPPPPQQQQAAGPAGKVPFAAAHVKLMTVPPGELAQRREKLVSILFERDGDYATSLISLEDKQSVLARISDRDIAQILKQPDVAALLDEVYSRNQKTQSSQRKGDGASASVQPAAAPQTDQQQQQRLGRRTSREAEQRAPAATNNRDAGDGRPPQLNPRSSAAATAAAGSAVAPQHVEAADMPVAAAREAATRSIASSAGDSVQSAGSAADQSQPRLQPPQRQMAPKQPHPLYAQPAAAKPGAADAWSATQQPPPAAATTAAIGRHGSHLVLDLSGPLESWMCHFKPAAVHVIEQLVSEADIKQQLLNIVAAAQEEQLAQALNSGLLPMLKRLHSSGAGPIPSSEGLLSFASLVAEAKALQSPVQPRLTAAPGQEPQPTPPAAPALAPSLALPPHLQHISRGQHQQQPGGMLPYPQQAAVPPPAALQQLLGAPLALPVQQQQQQPPAADPVPDGNQSDSEDEMLNSLMVHDNAGASQQPSSTPVWGPAQPPQQHSMISSEFPSLGASAPGSRVGPAVSSAGLANQTGEYNCFLNVVVQCLYSCKAFREQVRALPPYQQGNPVVHALLQLFEQMQAAEQGWKPGHDRTVVNPTELREALDSAAQFRRQEMNDANELIDCLFECFKAAQGSSNVTGSRGVLIDSVFGLKVKEKVRCTAPGCGVVSHVVGSRWEHLVMVNSMALGYAATDARYEYDLTAEAPLDLGRLLRVLIDQEQKACDKDLGGCGELYSPEKECEQSPRVLSLQMVWDPDISGAEIGTALAHILEDLDISAMYADGVANSDTTYQLSSAVAYYGQHYMAFVRNEKLNQWLIFDDASVNVVGSWEDVKRKCVNGRIQPSVLFYQAMDLAALPDRATAPLSAARPAAAAPGVSYHPVHGAYAAGPRPAAAAAGGQWGPTPSVVPHPMHLMQQQQPQQQHAPHPAAHDSSAMAPFIAHHDAAAATVSGTPPPAAAAAPQHPWDTAGSHSSSGNGHLTTTAASADAAAAPGWRNHNGSATDAWGSPASTLYPAAAAEVLSVPPAAAGVGPAQPRPAWGGAGRVAQVAFGGIAVQAARGEGGPTAAPGGHRGHGAARGRHGISRG